MKLRAEVVSNASGVDLFDKPSQPKILEPSEATPENTIWIVQNDLTTQKRALALSSTVFFKMFVHFNQYAESSHVDKHKLQDIY